MAAPDFPNVPLASADPALLLCWEEKVRQGLECSILFKHRRGKITTTLQTSCSNSLAAKTNVKVTVPQAEKTKKKKKPMNTKRLQALLSYHQRLVNERGLPPSRLMLQHASAAPSPSPPAQRPELKGSDEEFKCDKCDYTSTSKQGVSIHKGHQHKELKKPEILRVELLDKSLDLSQVSEDREEHEHSFSVTNTSTTPQESELDFTLSAESECGQCDFIGHTRSAIELHIVKNHSECTKCKSKFQNVEDIRNHCYDYAACDLAHVNMVTQMGGRVVPLR